VARYVCPKCGNTGPGAFRFDARTSNIRCRRCGAVAEFEPKDVTGVTAQAVKCPKCGRPLWESWDLSPPKGFPHHFYFCFDCDLGAAGSRREVTYVTWVVVWDLPGVVDPAARRRFYRWLRGATKDEPKVRRPLASLMEVDDYSLAQAIVNQVEGAGGTARLYRAQTTLTRGVNR